MTSDRIAAATAGKRGGYRTLLANRKGEKIFFLYGFEKSSRANVTDDEEKALKALTKVYLHFGENEISLAIKKGQLVEVKDE